MKALVCKAYGPPESLVIEDRPDPVPGDGEVCVDIRAAGLNYPDLLVISGNYQVKSPLPFVPGGEAAGVVSAVGPGVRRFQPGDRVITTPILGAFAEKCAVSERLCFPMPDSLDFDQGAGFTVAYATSYHALRQSAQLRSGETLLVLGAAGGVGTTAVEIGKAMGARVIAAASSGEKLAFAREVGADECINYSETGLKETVRELTDGRGVDVVYDPVGGELAQEAYRSLAWRGRYLVVGFASGKIPDFPANIALLKEASVTGVWWGTWSARHPDDALQNLVELVAMVERGDLEPRVTGRYPLRRFADAFAEIGGRRVRGKIVLAMD
ncbi:MAG: NADPH:quinone oxidoreductase family protein [Xanthomonadales bacterium]|nr:NADPH:quinone oxidoreductase family protein [Gammaproteobacteria bacterium]MBT8064269.1 NADPH:quinone oxidoreductase family protein [Gammaproteobacteria bacterium]NNJ65795.1 NADPH:quinone oxidoreductase family protein [Xanthomonadales bacterium]NNK32144.1 NADPH:quinone oxidoreductase family protein [Xanthomonadales bacterium]